MAAISFSDLIHPIDSLYFHREDLPPYNFTGENNEGPAACFGGSWVDLGLVTGPYSSVKYRAWYRQDPQS